LGELNLLLLLLLFEAAGLLMELTVLISGSCNEEVDLFRIAVFPVPEVLLPKSPDFRRVLSDFDPFIPLCFMIVSINCKPSGKCE
jgi:hypothetical protein